MQAKDFSLLIDDVRRVAYLLVAQLNLKHKVNEETVRTGNDFLKLFLSRYPDITIKKSEDVCMARSTDMSKPEIDAYFKILETVLLVE